MRVTLVLEIGNRTVIEQLVMPEDFRGDFRSAVQELASRVELSTFGPQLAEGTSFDEQLRMRGQ